MSRVAKSIINLPKDVECSIKNFMLEIKGPKGVLCRSYDNRVIILCKDRSIKIFPVSDNENKYGWSLAGTIRSLVYNMVYGVMYGYKIILEFFGIGYKVQWLDKNKSINLFIGYSHPVIYNIPNNVSIEILNNGTILNLYSIDKQLIGDVASKIRNLKIPDAYKGKGIRYFGEVINLKESKKK
ncbi:50S ribosomal protein L6 [Candidatus Legionella polyplacis]|uniref:50S ribosomal protein L6 n=1 Tax=Candidatus Legionella polyplacis TaxID=2005262 RepID=UPI000C1DFF8A|nr:50S ribosomal protein L6 [Candidatus Legionella polyplacis]ATW01752.1 50S ribosomal protein L6 [Candidatus Legionella polyplacis]